MVLYRCTIVAGFAAVLAGASVQAQVTRSSSASYPDLVGFQSSNSSAMGDVYEVLPGPAALNPKINPSPYSNNIVMTTGSYSLTVKDVNEFDATDSQDEVTSVRIEFTGSNGVRYLIDSISILKRAQSAAYNFFGGVGFNKLMDGDTGIGTSLLPKHVSFIYVAGRGDLKNADTGKVIAIARTVYIMVSTRIRFEGYVLTPFAKEDMSYHELQAAETHIILPASPQPIPDTDHGFLYVVFEKAEMSNPTHDWTLAYEVLPGPAALNPQVFPTAYSNSISIGTGSYSIQVVDSDDTDSADSRDAITLFSFSFQRVNGKKFVLDSLRVVHKSPDVGQYTYFGGVGLDETIHGNTGIGTSFMPKLFAYITVWAIGNLKDGDGNILAENRLVNIMITSRIRNERLEMVTNTGDDESDHSPDMVEAHVIVPPQDLNGNFEPVLGTTYGYLHATFEKVSLSEIRQVFAEESVPQPFTLTQNYPNPFNPRTTIGVTVPEDASGPVLLDVCDIRGDRVVTLVQGVLHPGLHFFVWDGRGEDGRIMATGVYFYRLRADGISWTRKMVLMK